MRLDIPRETLVDCFAPLERAIMSEGGRGTECLDSLLWALRAAVRSDDAECRALVSDAEGDSP